MKQKERDKRERGWYIRELRPAGKVVKTEYEITKGWLCPKENAPLVLLDPWEFYNVKEVDKCLFVILANVKVQQEEKILHFVNQYGVLGAYRLYERLGNEELLKPYISDNIPFEDLVLGRRKPEILIPTKHLPLYERIEDFRREQALLFSLLQLITAFRNKDTDSMARRLKENHELLCSVIREKEVITGIALYTQGTVPSTRYFLETVGLAYNIGAERFPSKAVKQAAKMSSLTQIVDRFPELTPLVAWQIINRLLARGFVGVTPTISLRQGQTKPYWTFDNLLSAIYLMIFLEMDRPVWGVEECAICRTLFCKVRKDQKYDKVQCTWLASKRKQREPKTNQAKRRELNRIE